jgi:hypothetical protein
LLYSKINAILKTTEEVLTLYFVLSHEIQVTLLAIKKMVVLKTNELVRVLSELLHRSIIPLSSAESQNMIMAFIV